MSVMSLQTSSVTWRFIRYKLRNIHVNCVLIGVQSEAHAYMVAARKLASSTFYFVGSSPCRLKQSPVLAFLSLKNVSIALLRPYPSHCGRLATTSVVRAISCLEKRGK